MNGQNVVSIREEEIDPSRAAHILGTYQYERQRPIRNDHVRMLAAAIQSDTLLSTPIELVHCKESGRTVLGDGQHRLTAVVLAKRPVKLLVVRREVDTEEQLHELYGRLDRGVGRTVGDVFRARGVANDLDLPVQITNLLGQAMVPLGAGFQHGTRVFQLLRRMADMRERLLREWQNEGRMLYGAIGMRTKESRGLWRSDVAAVALVTMRYQPEKSVVFWASIAANNGLLRNTPERTFADFLLDEGRKVNTVGKPGMARATAAAWNAHYQGRELQRVVVRDDTMMSPISIIGTPYNGVGVRVEDWIQEMAALSAIKQEQAAVI